MDDTYTRSETVAKIWMPWRSSPKQEFDCFAYHEDYGSLLKNTEKLAYLIRSYTVYEMTCAASGHPGGSLSETELLSVLFNYAMVFDPKNPKWEKRDVLYLSKCHCCPALYAVLALFGYFGLNELKGYASWGSILEGHPDWTKTPGIEISGGSLGQIPGVAVGRALAMSRKGPDHARRIVYCIIGDGECQEGSVWEAFMAASHYKLDNIVFLIDYNKVQAKGFSTHDMSIEPLVDKLNSFGHEVYEVQNGHDVSEIIDVFNVVRNRRAGKPVSIIFNTVKGKKILDANFNPNWHTSAPRNIEMAKSWLEQIWMLDGKRLGIPWEFVEGLGNSIEIVKPLHDNPDEIVEAMA